MARLPDVLTCEGLELRRWNPAFTEEMIVVIGESIAELREWMSWAQTVPAPDSLRQVLREGQRDFDADRSWEYAIFESDTETLLGGAGVRPSDRPGRFEIGYWVRSDRTGRGIATASTSALVQAAFTYLGEATQIVIRMDRANLASAAIPRKLNFTLEQEEDREVVAVGQTGRGYVWTLDRDG
jgi:RimJ/RimL family protein N-acetyltransferase